MDAAGTAAVRKVVWVIGGGSGVGRASALALSVGGWDVVLSGRRAQALHETAELVEESGGTATVLPYDIADDDAVAMAVSVTALAGRLDGIVVAAGLNSPQRTWADHDLAVVGQIVHTTVVGTAKAITAALPSLRETGGVVVIVSSYAGWTYQPSAGVAYGAAKTALATLARTLNTQEASAGVRACHLCPGDIDTDFLRMRPSVPDTEARALMLSAQDVAHAVAFVMNAPPHVRIDELVISTVSQV